MNNSSTQISTPVQSQNQLNIKELLFNCLAHWYWFVLSLAVCMGFMFFKMHKAIPMYSRHCSVMFKTRTASSLASVEDELNSLGVISMRSSVQNEILTFKSLDIMTEAVSRLHLYMDYQEEGRVRPYTIYGTSIPYTVKMLDLGDEDAGSFRMLDDNGKVILTDFHFKGEEFQKSITATVGDTLSTPLGRVLLIPTLEEVRHFRPIAVTKRTLSSAALSWKGRLTVAASSDKDADVVDLTLVDSNPQRAEALLNMVVVVYNDSWVADKNKSIVNAKMFINDKLAAIENELSDIDDDISAFKSRNLLPSVKNAASLYLKDNQSIEMAIQTLRDDLANSKYFKTYLTDEANNGHVLPLNPGLSNSAISAEISKYNNLIMQRQSLVSNSSEKNVLVIDLDKDLKNIRETLLASVDNNIHFLEVQIDNLNKQKKEIQANLSENPIQEEELTTSTRLQNVKEGLYLYLLQKREENELSQAFTAYNNRMIEAPTGSSSPVSPNKRNMYMIAFLLGLAIPGGIIYLLEVTNTKVRSKKDIEFLQVPFLGEVPQVNKQSEGNRFVIAARNFILPKSVLKKMYKEKEKADTGEIIVKHGSRNMINEAFRILRTNLEFVTKGKDAKVIEITSFNAGSGKSFISKNLAACLTLKGFNVLLVDGDLRHASVSKVVGSPKKGISDYLAGKDNDIDNVIVAHPDYKGLSVLPVGTIPPNPTELVSDEKFSTLIKGMKEKFDYIIVDCPPVDVVADAQIINAVADATMFIARANLLEKEMVPSIDGLFNEKKFKGMNLVLNGTTSDGHGHYRYHYGYRYGYHYGNEYGYHYHSYDED